MKIIIACLLTLALLLVGVSTFLNFSRLETEKEPVKDTTVDKDQNDKGESPSDEPTDDPSDQPSDDPVEEVSGWTAVELTEFVDEDYTSSLTGPAKGNFNYFKFTVEEAGLYSFNPVGYASYGLVDYSSKGVLFHYADDSKQCSLEPGEYILYCAVDYDIELYRYRGDFSEFQQSKLCTISTSDKDVPLSQLGYYQVLKVVTDEPVVSPSVPFALNELSGSTISLDIIWNDGDGTLYVPLSLSGDYSISTLYVYDSTVFGTQVTLIEVYGITVHYYENENEAVVTESDLTPLSMRTSVETELEAEAEIEAETAAVPEIVIEEPEVTESSEIISWSKVDGQEIVEYSDGRTFINGVEVQWSDILIVG